MDKKLMALIRKAIMYNVLLLVYFFSPTFIAFCVIMVILALIFFEDATSTIIDLVSIIQPENEECSLLKLNKWVQKYNEMTLIMRNFINLF